MSSVLLVILGFSISFAGTIPPSMLNLTTTKITLESDKSSAIKFAIGVSVVIFIQAYLAFVFTRYIHNTIVFDRSISIVGIFIFIALSFYFFRQAQKESKTTISTLKDKNHLRYGVLLAFLNMFSIPFYCGVATILSSNGWIVLNNLNILLFVIGSSLGTFTLLYAYASAAKTIDKKAHFLSKNINYVLSFITLSVAIITIFNVL